MCELDKMLITPRLWAVGLPLVSYDSRSALSAGQHGLALRERQTDPPKTQLIEKNVFGTEVIHVECNWNS